MRPHRDDHSATIATVAIALSGAVALAVFPVLRRAVRRRRMSAFERSLWALADLLPATPPPGPGELWLNGGCLAFTPCQPETKQMREYLSSTRVPGGIRRCSRIVTVADYENDLVVERRHSRIFVVERSVDGLGYFYGSALDLSEADARVLHEELGRVIGLHDDAAPRTRSEQRSEGDA